jgi:hypothetical protein
MTESYTFEEHAGAEKLVEWFHAQGFQIDATAPRIDNDWAVEIFSTEEALTGFPYTPDEPYPDVRTFQLAIEILDENSTGAWWDTKGWYPTEEEREPWS